MIDKFDGEYRFLSNFYVCQVTYNDITYNSSEHAYQAAKATNKEDFELFKKEYPEVNIEILFYKDLRKLDIIDSGGYIK